VDPVGDGTFLLPNKRDDVRVNSDSVSSIDAQVKISRKNSNVVQIIDLR
jgi:hypothetical protein